MKILAWTLGALAALVAIVAGVGFLLPVRHRASRQATFPASPDVVFGAITKVEDVPTWRSEVTKVDVIATAPEKPSWRETWSNGAIVFVFMSRFVFGHTATIDTYLRDLGAKLSS